MNSFAICCDTSDNLRETICGLCEIVMDDYEIEEMDEVDEEILNSVLELYKAIYDDYTDDIVPDVVVYMTEYFNRYLGMDEDDNNKNKVEDVDIKPHNSISVCDINIVKNDDICIDFKPIELNMEDIIFTTVSNMEYKTPEFTKLKKPVKKVRPSILAEPTSISTETKEERVLLKNIDYEMLIGSNVENVTNYNTPEYREYLKNCLGWIENQPVQEQRSVEWYEYRNSMMTASELYKIFTSDKSRQSFVNSKVTLKTNKTGKACLHGIVYEPMARSIYENRYGVCIKEYGCIRHRDIMCLGASPDGICVSGDNKLYGRVVEIKCPISRVIDGIVPLEYAIQVQTQLEVLDLDYCDYCEFQFKEFGTREEYEEYRVDEDVFETNDDNNGIINDMKSSLNNEKGVIITVLKENDMDYLYSGIGLCGKELDEWLDGCITQINDSNEYLGKIIYWKLGDIHVKTIRRNRVLFDMFKPEILNTWKMIEEERNKQQCKEPGVLNVVS